MMTMIKAGDLVAGNQIEYDGERLEIISIIATKASVIIECRPVLLFSHRSQRRIVLRKSDMIRKTWDIRDQR